MQECPEAVFVPLNPAPGRKCPHTLGTDWAQLLILLTNKWVSNKEKSCRARWKGPSVLLRLGTHSPVALSGRNDALQGSAAAGAPLQQLGRIHERLQPSAPCAAALARCKGALGRCQRLAYGKDLQARRRTGTIPRFVNLPATFAVHCKPSEQVGLADIATVCSVQAAQCRGFKGLFCTALQVIDLVHEPPAGVAAESEEAEADDWSLYDYPALYHRVFGYRNFSKEVRCLSFSVKLGYEGELLC